MMPQADNPARDPVRALFALAVALGLAALLLREVLGVRLIYDSLGVVLLVAWGTAGIAVVASLVEAARRGRMRSLYFAVTLIVGHLLAFHEEMDGDATFGLIGLLCVLLVAVIIIEGEAIVRRLGSKGYRVE